MNVVAFIAFAVIAMIFGLIALALIVAPVAILARVIRSRADFALGKPMRDDAARELEAWLAGRSDSRSP